MRTLHLPLLLAPLFAAVACQSTEPDEVATEAVDAVEAPLPNVRYYMIADT